MTKSPTGKFVNCFCCNKKFYIPKNRFNTAKYCSRKCKNKFCTVQITAKCKICDKVFTHISSRVNKAKYCSRKCYYIAQKGKGSKEFICFNCGKKFMSSPSKRYKFCTPKCRGEYQREPETYSSFTDVRKAWFRRGWIKKCEVCGFDKNPEILGLHHKNKNRKDQSKNNLIVLCPNCHSLINKKHVPH